MKFKKFITVIAAFLTSFTLITPTFVSVGNVEAEEIIDPAELRKSYGCGQKTRISLKDDDMDIMKEVFGVTKDNETRTAEITPIMYFIKDDPSCAAYCLDPRHLAAFGKTYSQDSAVYQLSQKKELYEKIAKDAYYGYGYRPGDRIHRTWYAATQLLIWMDLGVINEDFYVFPDSETNTEECWEKINTIKALRDRNAPLTRIFPYSDGLSYVYSYPGSQKIMRGGLWLEPQKIKIRKTSSDADMTASNPQYSLAGASYSIYLENPNVKKSAKILTTLTTNKDGYAESPDLPVSPDQTLYIQETAAPDGYELDPEVHSFVINNYPDKTYVCEETPIGAVPNLSVVKKDADGRSNPPSLAGARFTVNHYADDTMNSSPLHTWNLETYANGSRYTADFSHIVSGPRFTDSEGNFILPLGTYTIEETCAPEGFAVSDSFNKKMKGKAIFRVVNNNGAAEIEYASGFDDEITCEDPSLRGTFKLKKEDRKTGSAPQGDAKFSGGKFSLYYIGDLNGGNGSAFIDGKEYAPSASRPIKSFSLEQDGTYTGPDGCLSAGKYCIEEVEAPEGYSNIDPDSGGPLRVSFTVDGNNDASAVSITMKDDVLHGKIKLVKHKGDVNGKDTGKPEEGAEFIIIRAALVQKTAPEPSEILHAWETLHTSHEDETDLICTGPDGTAVSKDLVYGTYYAVQSDGNADYELNPGAVSFRIDGKSSEALLIPTVINTEKSYFIRIVKEDADTKERITASPASFQIRKVKEADGTDFSSAHLSDAELSDLGLNRDGYLLNGSGTTFQTVTKKTGNDEPGTVTLPVRVGAGTYELTEIKAPKGYLRNPVIPGSSDTRFTISSKSATVSDGTGTPIISVICYDRQKTGKVQIQKKLDGYAADNSLVEQTNLTQFGFTLYRNDSSDHLTALETKNCQSDGKVQFEGLHAGTYTLRETICPQGVKPVKSAYNIVLYDDENKDALTVKFDNNAESGCHTVLNKISKTQISKKAVTGNDEIPGAEFSVIDKETGKTVIHFISADKPHTIAGLKYDHDYLLREEGAPQGYVAAGDLPFRVEADGSVTKVTVKNKRFSVLKTDTDGKPVSQAELSVTDQKGTEIDHWITSGKPHCISGLRIGTAYILKEIHAPAGFSCIQEKTFTVKNDSEDEIMTCVDTKVFVSKQDLGGSEIPGARLKVAEKKSGQVIDSWISTEQIHQISGLVQGKTYVLIEDTAPLGYVKNSSVVFTVHDTKDMEVILNDTIERAAKLDESGRFLSGAVLSAVLPDGTKADTWTSGTHIVDLSQENRIALREGKDIRISLSDGREVHVAPQAEISERTVSKHRRQIILLPSEETETENVELSKTVFSAEVISADGTSAWYDIDLNGNEAWHRIRGLVSGTEYTLQEEKAPKGYYCAKAASLSPDDFTDHLTEMTDSPVRCRIAKVDSETGDYVSGVTLGLFDITTGKTEINLPNHGLTGNEPILLEGVLLPEHKYCLEELNAPPGYWTAASLEFKIPKYGTDEPITVTMKDVPSSVTVMKAEPDGTPVAGAELSILEAVQDSNGKWIPALDNNGKEISVGSFTSTDDPEGTDISSYVIGGSTYILRESEAPFGFDIINDMPFTVSGTPEKHQVIQAVDERSQYDVVIEKTDKYDSSCKLQGAEITLYTEDGKIAHDVSGKECKGITDAEGRVTFRVKYNSDTSGYYALETKAPDNYHLNNTKYPVVLDDNYTFDPNDPVVIQIEDRHRDFIPKTSTLTGTESLHHQFAALTVSGILLILLQKLLRYA